MIKRWLCLALALMVAWASLSLAEEVVIDNDAVILDASEGEVIIEDLPEDIGITEIESLDLDLMEPGAAGGLLDLDQPDSREAAQEEDAAELVSDADPVLKLSAAKLVIGIKEKCTILKATRVPEDSSDTVTWSSSKTSVAKVDKKTGKITGVSRRAPPSSPRRRPVACRRSARSSSGRPRTR